MRWFRFEPGGGYADDGRAPVSEALESITGQLEGLGARKAVLIVEDDEGVTMAIGRLGDYDDAPQTTVEMLLRVALDAKEMLS